MKKIKQALRKSILSFFRAGKVGSTNWSTRDAWIEKTLQAIPAGQRILDAGAGELQYRRFCSHLNYISQDFAQYNGQGNGAGLQTGTWDQSRIDIVSDIAHIPRPDASFDAVMCVEVLEHVPYPESTIHELARLLRPGGVLVLTAPFCALAHFSPYFYQTGYSANFYEYWLPRLGLEIQEIVYNGNYFEYLAQELNRLPFVAKKYSRRLRPWEYLPVWMLLGVLNSLSKQDNNSKELLTYGLMVKAKKIAI